MSRVGHDRPSGRLALDIGCHTGYLLLPHERHGGDRAAGSAGTMAETVAETSEAETVTETVTVAETVAETSVTVTVTVSGTVTVDRGRCGDPAPAPGRCHLPLPPTF